MYLLLYNVTFKEMARHGRGCLMSGSLKDTFDLLMDFGRGEYRHTHDIFAIWSV